MSMGMLQILQVEDHDGDARLTELLLGESAAGTYRIDRANTLADAASRLATSRFDAILLDLQLPDSRGLETYLAINALALETPVIVLSGSDDEGIALDAVRQGAQDYLVKGTFDGNLMNKAIRYAIERHRLQTALRRMALLDPLTGLFNRRGFDLLASQQLRLAERRGSSSCLLVIDVDGMKQINDRHGHAAGDRALCGVSEILRETFRGSDVLARIGGDEFVALCFDVRYPSQPADTICHRLQQRLERWNSRTGEFSLGFSVGMAGSGQDGAMDPAKLFRLADQRMYRNKQQRTMAADLEGARDSSLPPGFQDA